MAMKEYSTGAGPLGSSALGKREAEVYLRSQGKIMELKSRSKRNWQFGRLSHRERQLPGAVRGVKRHDEDASVAIGGLEHSLVR